MSNQLVETSSIRKSVTLIPKQGHAPEYTRLNDVNNFQLITRQMKQENERK